MEANDIAKKLLSLDEECRALREEVALLEKTRRFRQQEISLITEMPGDSTSPKSSKGNKSQVRSTTLPLEAVGDLSNKTGEVTLLMQENKRLIKESEDLRSLLETCKDDTTIAEEENEAFKQRTGCSDVTDAERLKQISTAENITKSLRRDLIDALHRRDVLQQMLQRQNYNMRELTGELIACQSLEEDREEAKQLLAEKRQELESIREEVRSMRRLLERKDRLLQKDKPMDEIAMIQSADTDRRVAQYRLDREQENVRIDNASIRHRALQIAKLEKRIEMIGDAVGGDESATEERVDAELLEELRKEIGSLARLHREGGARLDILDAEIEDMDRKNTGLHRTTANVNKEVKRIERDHKRFTAAQKKELEREQEQTENEIKDLQNEIDALRHAPQHSGARRIKS